MNVGGGVGVGLLLSFILCVLLCVRGSCAANLSAGAGGCSLCVLYMFSLFISLLLVFLYVGGSGGGG